MAERTIGGLAFGTSDTATNSAGNVTAKTENKTVVEANQARVALILANNGAKDVWVALGATATAEKGILLKKEGAGNQPLVLQGYTGAVSVIAKENESVVSFSEI